MEVVVTGTKTFKRQTDSPVIVNVMDSKSLTMVQACDISEGLAFSARVARGKGLPDLQLHAIKDEWAWRWIFADID